MKNRVWLSIWTLAVLCMVGCSGSGEDKQDRTESTPAFSKPVIFVVNYPLQYFAERIGGNQVEVEFPAPADVDPAFWNPDAETIGAYQQADLILLNGATYAKWTAKVSLPESKTVDTSAKFAERYIVTTEATTHSHGPGGEHAHTGTAFTTWIDFNQAVQQAHAILSAYSQRWPEQKSAWERGYRKLEQDLMALDATLQNTVAGKQSLPLVASHPVYQYFARRYALNLASVLWEPDGFPTERQWRELSQLVEDRGAKWMVWEGDPLPESVARLDEIGVGSVVFDPCGNVPEAGDFVSVMRQNIERMTAVYR